MLYRLILYFEGFPYFFNLILKIGDLIIKLVHILVIILCYKIGSFEKNLYLLDGPLN